MDKAREGLQQRGIKVRKAFELLGGVNVTSTEGRRFRTSQGTAFTLCDGKIVGDTRANGTTMSYSIPAIEVVREYLAHANKQDVEAVRNLACERLDELAA